MPEAWRQDSDGVWHEAGSDEDDILRKGFAAVPALISTNLAADILDGVDMSKAQIISNALQQAVSGELRRRVEEALRTSSALADLVEQVFGVRTFRVKGVKRLTNPYKAEPQMPHADDFMNRELIGVVQLRDGQRPTEANPYNPGVCLPTGVFVPCSSCGACSQVGDAQLRRREVDATSFECEGCACGLDGSAMGPRDLAACERVFVSTVFKAFGPLLERHGSTLQSVQEAMRPCGGPEAACGDAVIALPTLIHRGPGNASTTETRDVLFFTLQPFGFGGSRGPRSKAVPVPPIADDDMQVSAPWLLTLGQRTGLLGQGLYERVEASYALRGISFGQFLVDEKLQPSSKKKAERGGLVSVFRPPRKTSLSSSSHATADGSEDDEASEAVATSETEVAAIAAPSVRPLKASKQKSSSATTFDRCGTFGCTLPDRHPGLHSFTMCEIRSRHLVQPPEPTPSKGMAATPQKKSVTSFDRCGTFGCTLPDRHLGLHAFSVDDTRPRRRVNAFEECQVVPAGADKKPGASRKTAPRPMPSPQEVEKPSTRKRRAPATVPMHRSKGPSAEQVQLPPTRTEAREPDTVHPWPFPVLIPPEALCTSSTPPLEMAESTEQQKAGSTRFRWHVRPLITEGSNKAPPAAETGKKRMRTPGGGMGALVAARAMASTLPGPEMLSCIPCMGEDDLRCPTHLRFT